MDASSANQAIKDLHATFNPEIKAALGSGFEALESAAHNLTQVTTSVLTEDGMTQERARESLADVIKEFEDKVGAVGEDWQQKADNFYSGCYDIHPFLRGDWCDENMHAVNVLKTGVYDAWEVVLAGSDRLISSINEQVEQLVPRTGTNTASVPSTLTPSLSPSISGSTTVGASGSETVVVSRSMTGSATVKQSLTASGTGSTTQSGVKSASRSGSATGSATAKQSDTQTGTATHTNTNEKTTSPSGSGTGTATGVQSSSASASRTESVSQAQTSSLTASPSSSPSGSRSATDQVSMSASPSRIVTRFLGFIAFLLIFWWCSLVSSWLLRSWLRLPAPGR